MSSRKLRLAMLVLVLCGSLPAALVTPPSVDWVSLPASANVGQTVSVGVGAHANASDNSDGNDWNGGSMVVARIMVDVQQPGQSTWTRIYEWLPTWQTPATIWTSFTMASAGTAYVRIQVMDGRPWYSGVYTYSLTAATPSPAITSQLTMSVNQGQSVSYGITASNSPSSYGASGLPAGLSVNSSTGVISGTIPTNAGTQGTTTTVNSTITATNASGTDSKTLVWTVNAASILTSGSVSPTVIGPGGSITLTRSASANFGLAWTESTIWRPDGSAVSLGNQQLGTQTYTPNGGNGTYYWQFRVVDTYSNYLDQWIAFNVTPATPPSSVQSSLTGSYFVTLSWSGGSAANGIAGYNVYRNGTKLNTALVTGSTYTDSTAAPGSAYSYAVTTVDSLGNESALSSPLAITTAASFELFTPLP